MFNYYDRNSDHLLTEDELEDIEHRDHLERLSRFCQLTDMLEFDDKEEDGNISLSEFYVAFSEYPMRMSLRAMIIIPQLTCQGQLTDNWRNQRFAGKWFAIVVWR